MKRFRKAVMALSLAAGLSFGVAAVAAADPADRVTICHATGSSTNPYVSVTASGNGIYSGHIAHQHGNDIIPQFTIASGPHAGTYGPQGDQSILANGCQVVTPPTGPTTPTGPTNPTGPTTPTGPTSPTTGPSGPTQTPPPNKPDKPNGPDKPPTPKLHAPKGTAFTGVSEGTLWLGLGAFLALMVGLLLYLRGKHDTERWA